MRLLNLGIVAHVEAGKTTLTERLTPGHSDFVAEVERALAVLDVAVLVVSAVEGVQAQTRVLIRILERLRIVAITRPTDVGNRSSTVRPRRGAHFLDDLVVRLADYDDQALRRYVDGAHPLNKSEALAALARLTADGSLHPVYFGAALTGIGVADVIHAGQRRRDRQDRRPGRHRDR